jgi:3'-phosphoadenosine 5'-phosphosulfate sulfotransferase (PAPS reductase)/FAD synthetase
MVDPFKIIEPTVISFSGGRTSAYMLWRVLESNNGLPDEAIVCFANTGKEENATLQFVNNCEKNWGVKIHWIEYRAEKPYFERVTFETASRDGKPFESLIRKRKFLPNSMMRFCTSELKVLAIDRYLKSIEFGDYVTMVGIRADEPRRVAKMKNNKDEKLTPLATAGVSEADVWKFWNQQHFDLGLVKASGSSNCDLCFLKGGGIIQSLINEKPDRAIWWAEMEKVVGGKFRNDRPSYQDLLNYQNNQANLFSDETISCFCGD